MEKLITAFRNAAKMNQMAQAVRESLTEGTMKITDIRGGKGVIWYRGADVSKEPATFISRTGKYPFALIIKTAGYFETSVTKYQRMWFIKMTKFQKKTWKSSNVCSWLLYLVGYNRYLSVRTKLRQPT